MSESASRFGGTRDMFALVSNAASLALLAVAGVAISALLANGFGVNVVGQFNQLATLLIVCAQVAALGIHLSCLHYLGGEQHHGLAQSVAAQAAIMLVLLCGSVTGLCVFALADTIEQLFASPGIAMGVRWLGPAVTLFGVNKVLLALLNAQDRLHTFALLQAVRPLVWLLATAAVVTRGQANPAELGMLLFAGEAVAALCGVLLLGKTLFVGLHVGQLRSWMAKHFSFGWRAAPSHLIIDLNTRVDVLVLAVFMSDAAVGVYSFVALLAEGVFQVGVLVRTIVNRRLVNALVNRDVFAFASLRRSAGAASLVMTVASSALLLTLYFPAVELLNLDKALLDGWLPMAILLLGVCTCAMYSPFWMSIALAGFPAAHSGLMLALLAVNLAINVLAVPTLGVVGAALATAIMFAAFPFMLRWTALRTLGMRL